MLTAWAARSLTIRRGGLDRCGCRFVLGGALAAPVGSLVDDRDANQATTQWKWINRSDEAAYGVSIRIRRRGCHRGSEDQVHLGPGMILILSSTALFMGQTQA